MPFDRGDLDYFDSMIEAAERIFRHIGPLSEAEFINRMIVFDAVCLNLIRIGEAARFLSEAAKAALPETHWPDVVTLRNRIAHGYASLDARIIWLTATKDVPELATRISALMERPD
ncbi:MAG: HepT-like ribonuclease domain-containing protein [Brevundimonas sp.]|uniref:HepT-like ribonuclease domain-containing protein n=1 Tax=Brevundimonas sp. TaxID=1871086 RepID=UPI0027358D54|nr:HepT-like ribonuclease domain-containing protein [Brevundimonas sp.]MDZ4109592.1 HepT-like ribonuclease domain-containing protein [Brevundimonas sp.]MDZ4320464.1 HepT-like ribonuclease domain-containing protein [Phenylobacterium sp.]